MFIKVQTQQNKCQLPRIKPVQESIKDTIQNNTNTQKLNIQQNKTKQKQTTCIKTLTKLQ